MNIETVITESVSILTDASTLFIVSAGLTLVFGGLRLINMAHGSFYMIGALGTTTAVAAFGIGGSAGFWLALLVVPVAVAALGAGVEVTVLRRIYGKEDLAQLLATFALLLVFGDLGLRLWGSDDRTLSPPGAVGGRFHLDGAVVPQYNLVVVAVAAVVGAGLWLLLGRTTVGWRIRAATEDPESLAVGGTNLALLRTGVFALGAALAAIGGAAIAPLEAVGPGLDTQIIVSAFIVTVVGGLGSIQGAALGALVIATVETLGTLWVPSYASSAGYIVMILVLAVRPWGLFGTPER